MSEDKIVPFQKVIPMIIKFFVFSILQFSVLDF